MKSKSRATFHWKTFSQLFHLFYSKLNFQWKMNKRKNERNVGNIFKTKKRTMLYANHLSQRKFLIKTLKSLDRDEKVYTPFEKSAA